METRQSQDRTASNSLIGTRHHLDEEVTAIQVKMNDTAESVEVLGRRFDAVAQKLEKQSKTLISLETKVSFSLMSLSQTYQ